jgi:hypothetical protein
MKRICVFCGSCCGKGPEYRAAAVEMVAELVRRHLDWCTAAAMWVERGGRDDRQDGSRGEVGCACTQRADEKPISGVAVVRNGRSRSARSVILYYPS